jgi:hypothetical protein
MHTNCASGWLSTRFAYFILDNLHVKLRCHNGDQFINGLWRTAAFPSLSLSKVCCESLITADIATCNYFQTQSIQRIIDPQQVWTMFTVQWARINEKWHATGKKNRTHFNLRCASFLASPENCSWNLSYSWTSALVCKTCEKWRGCKLRS